MAEDVNETPAVAPQATESVETPINTNEPSAAPVSETPFLDKMDKKDLASIDKFLANNGGIEAFNKWKQAVSNPAPATKEEPKAAEPAQPAAPVQQPTAPVKQEGYLSPTDIAYIQYSRILASDKKYEKLSEYIGNGSFIDEMKSLGMSPVDAAGNVNDDRIRKFLDLKVQTIPAEAPSTPSASATPTVDYVNVGDEIKSREDAMAVINQAGHPMHDKAMEFLRDQIFGKAPKPVEKK